RRRTTAASGRRRSQQRAGERGRADDAGPLAERGRYEAHDRTVTTALEVLGERRAERLEQQRPELDEAAGDHDELRVEDVRERHETDGDVVAEVAEQPARLRVTLARRGRNRETADRVDVAARGGQDRGALAARHQLARH